MKSIFVIASFFIGSISFSQFFLGPEVGANLIHFNKSDLGHDFRLGFHGGLRTSYYFNDYLSIYSGVYFTQKSQSFSDADTTPVSIFGFKPEDLGIPGTDFNKYAQTEGVITQSYLEVPLMVTYSYQGFSVSTGIYFNGMIRAWTRSETNTEVPFMKLFDFDSFDTTGFISAFLPPAESTTFSETSDKTNLRCWDIGFRSVLSFQPNRFGVHLSYNLGFQDYRVNRGIDIIRRHSYCQLSISYLFGFGSQDLPSSRY